MTPNSCKICYSDLGDDYVTFVFDTGDCFNVERKLLSKETLLTVHEKPMTEPTDRLKIREIEQTDSEKVIQDAFDNSFPKVANGLTASQLEQVIVMADSGQIKSANHLIHIFLKQNAGSHIVHENPFKRKQLDCISFARFYHERSGSEPPLSDVEIYAMWQEKSMEKPKTSRELAEEWVNKNLSNEAGGNRYVKHNGIQYLAQIEPWSPNSFRSIQVHLIPLDPAYKKEMLEFVGEF